MTIDAQKLYADLADINKRVGAFIEATEGRSRQMTLAALKSLTHQIDCSVFKAQKRDTARTGDVR